MNLRSRISLFSMSSIFTKIIERQIPAHIVAEDEHHIAFLDINPLTIGHTLVIPKDNTENLHDADPTILGHTMRTTQIVAAAVKQAFDAPGIMIAQLNGPAAGQTVFHLHFHILPRHEGIEFRMHARDMADFGLLDGASLVDQGENLAQVNNDFCNVPRNDGSNDLGAVEYSPGTECDTTVGGGRQFIFRDGFE